MGKKRLEASGSSRSLQIPSRLGCGTCGNEINPGNMSFRLPPEEQSILSPYIVRPQRETTVASSLGFVDKCASSPQTLVHGVGSASSGVASMVPLRQPRLEWSTSAGSSLIVPAGEPVLPYVFQTPAIEFRNSTSLDCSTSYASPSVVAPVAQSPYIAKAPSAQFYNSASVASNITYASPAPTTSDTKAESQRMQMEMSWKMQEKEQQANSLQSQVTSSTRELEKLQGVKTQLRSVQVQQPPAWPQYGVVSTLGKLYTVGLGIYEIVNAVLIKQSVEPDSLQLGELPPKTFVKVLEVKVFKDRVRARIEKPPGWISIINVSTGVRFAMKQENNEEMRVNVVEERIAEVIEPLVKYGCEQASTNPAPIQSTIGSAGEYQVVEALPEAVYEERVDFSDTYLDGALAKAVYQECFDSSGSYADRALPEAVFNLNVDFSGNYVDMEGNMQTITQLGSEGHCSGGWFFTVAGNVASIKEYDVTGSFAEREPGDVRRIFWSDGNVYEEI